MMWRKALFIALDFTRCDFLTFFHHFSEHVFAERYEVKVEEDKKRVMTGRKIFVDQTRLPQAR